LSQNSVTDFWFDVLGQPVLRNPQGERERDVATDLGETGHASGLDRRAPLRERPHAGRHLGDYGGGMEGSTAVTPSIAVRLKPDTTDARPRMFR